MRKILLGLILFLLINQASAYEYSRKTYSTSIWDFQIRLFKLDLLWDDRLVIWISDKWESLESLIKRYNWKAGIAWSFFCPKDYTNCWWINLTNADRFSYGQDFSRWTDTWDRYVFALDKDALAFLYHSSKLNSEMRSEIHMWIWNHPLILKDWENMLEYYYDKGLIDKKMPASRPKSFICSTNNLWEIYMWVVKAAHMDDLPTVLSEIWCTNALNLDAGKTLALYNNWEYYLWPGRDMMDAVIITNKVWDEKNKKLVNLADSYKKDLIKKIKLLTGDKAKQQIIIQKVVDKIDLLEDKSYWARKTLLMLLKNNLLKELWENIAFR